MPFVMILGMLMRMTGIPNESVPSILALAGWVAPVFNVNFACL